VLLVSTVKFDLHEDLEELQARIFLSTRVKLTKKEVLELVFRIGTKDFQKIIEEIKPQANSLDEKTIESVLELVEDFGPGTEDLSSRIDEITYGFKKEINK
jgi:hypothetical protein